MIVVTGATGQLGQDIVRRLAAHVSSSQIGASVRDPAKADDLAALGVRVRRGDFAEPDTLPQAFEGATQLLLVSSNAGAYGGDPLAQHRAAIAAARDAGVKRIVYTSHMGVGDRSAFPPMRDHFATEEMLRDSGLAWTSLRNGFYAASAVALMGDASTTGSIEAPADGKVSWTAHADLAEAAALILADEGRFDGPTPPLTASESLDLSDLATIASELTGRPIRREIITDDEQRTRMAARGAPPRAADMVIGLYVASRTGEFAATDPTLERLLGRKPIPMRDVIAAKMPR